MSDGDGGKRYPHLGYFGVVASIILACVLVGALAYLEGRESERRRQSPHRHAESAKTSARNSCLSTDPSNVFDCVYEKVEAAEEHAYSEQDLSAQERAATSAMVAAAVGFVTLIISGGGLLALLETIRQGRGALEEARKGNQISRDEMEASHRPILEVEPFGPLARDEKLMSLGEGERRTIQLRVGAKVKNVGNGDAEIIRFCIGGMGKRHECLDIRRRLRKDTEDYLASADGIRGYQESLDAYSDPSILNEAEAARGREDCLWRIQHIYDSMEIVDTNPILIREPPPFVVQILYRDVLGIERIAGFGFRPVHMRGYGFKPFGDERLNYDRKVEK